MPDPGGTPHTPGVPGAPGAPAPPAPQDDTPAAGPPAVPAPDGPPTADQLRRAAARYATGITVITTVAGGVDHAMTANSFTTVSLDPLLALVCVARDSRFHDAVLSAGTWSASVLPEGQEATARWFATRGRALAGQFAGVATRRGANGCLLLSDGLAGLELRTTQVVRAGDHDVLIAEVTAIHDPDPAGRPLVYFASQFHTLS